MVNTHTYSKGVTIDVWEQSFYLICYQTTKTLRIGRNTHLHIQLVGKIDNYF